MLAVIAKLNVKDEREQNSKSHGSCGKGPTNEPGIIYISSARTQMETISSWSSMKMQTLLRHTENQNTSKPQAQFAGLMGGIEKSKGRGHYQIKGQHSGFQKQS